MSRIDAKVVLLGKSCVGKTCLVNRYCHSRFDPNLQYKQTIGAGIGVKRETVGNKSILLGIWDTVGTEKFLSMTKMYYRGAAASILCYDITDKTSFDQLQFWAGELREVQPDCKIYLAGTKVDIVQDNPNKREVTKGMAEPLAEDFHSILYETSARTGENIEELFKQIASDLMEQRERQKPKHQDQLHVDERLHLNNKSRWKLPCSFLGCSS